MVTRRWRSVLNSAGWTAGASLVLLLVCVLASGCATTSTPAARTTATATTTATANPLTPTPTATEARLETLVRQAVGSGPQQVQAVYHAAAGELNINLALIGTIPTAPAAVSAMQEQVKVLCFEAQRAVWSSGLTPLSQVTVTVVGPIMDQYAELETQAYGAAVLKAATERGFSWSTLSPDGAWGAYDNSYLRPAYYDVD